MALASRRYGAGMPRVAPKPPVQPKLFRHFAVLTLALAAVLALFATGERREALESQLAETSERNKLAAAELELAKKGKGGNTSLVFKDNRRNTVKWAPDSSVPVGTGAFDEAEEDGAEMATVGPTFIDAPNAVGGTGETFLAPPPGMTMEQMIALKKQKKKKSKRKPSPEDLDELRKPARMLENPPDE